LPSARWRCAKTKQRTTPQKNLTKREKKNPPPENTPHPPTPTNQRKQKTPSAAARVGSIWTGGRAMDAYRSRDPILSLPHVGIPRRVRSVHFSFTVDGPNFRGRERGLITAGSSICTRKAGFREFALKRVMGYEPGLRWKWAVSALYRGMSALEGTPPINLAESTSGHIPREWWLCTYHRDCSAYAAR